MSDEQTPLEGRLRTLTPAPPGFDRDETLLRMGRATAPTGPGWKFGTLAASLVAVGFGLAWWHTRATVVEVERIVERIVERVVSVPPPAPTPGDQVGTWHSAPEIRDLPTHLRVQEQLLRHGLEGLSVVPTRLRDRTPTKMELLQSIESTDQGAP